LDFESLDTNWEIDQVAWWEESIPCACPAWNNHVFWNSDFLFLPNLLIIHTWLIRAIHSGFVVNKRSRMSKFKRHRTCRKSDRWRPWNTFRTADDVDCERCRIEKLSMDENFIVEKWRRHNIFRLQSELCQMFNSLQMFLSWTKSTIHFRNLKAPNNIQTHWKWNHRFNPSIHPVIITNKVVRYCNHSRC
jgi:hypothetical protein